MGSGTSSHVAAIVGSGLVGLAVGSFLNVVAYRLPRRMSIVRPGSHCPSCGTPLTALDTVPVASWVALRGRCRHCRAPVSARYPLIEAVTGIAFAASAAALNGLDPLPSIALVAAGAVAAAVIDAAGQPVPSVLGLGAAVGAVSLVAVSAATGQPGRLVWAAVGAVLSGGVTALTTLAERRAPPRSQPLPEGPRWGAGRWAVLATLGWIAGWLWPPAAGIAAGWLVLAAMGATRSGGSGRAAAPRRVPLGLLAGGVFAVALAAAVVGRP